MRLTIARQPDAALRRFDLGGFTAAHGQRLHGLAGRQHGLLPGRGMGGWREECGVCHGLHCAGAAACAPAAGACHLGPYSQGVRIEAARGVIARHFPPGTVFSTTGRFRNGLRLGLGGDWTAQHLQALHRVGELAVQG